MENTSKYRHETIILHFLMLYRASQKWKRKKIVTMQYDFRFASDIEGTVLWFQYTVAIGNLKANEVPIWMGAEQLFLYNGSSDRSKAVDLCRGRDTNTEAAAKCSNFCPTLENWDALQQHLKHLQGASTGNSTAHGNVREQEGV